MDASYARMRKSLAIIYCYSLHGRTSYGPVYGLLGINWVADNLRDEIGHEKVLAVEKTCESHSPYYFLGCEEIKK